MESTRSRSFGRPQPGLIGLVSIAGIVLGLAIIGLSIAMASTLDDPGHPQFHATSAIVVLGLALLIAGGNRRRSVARRAIAIACLLLATSFLVEGVGGFGFDHQGRNDLAAIHDLGLGVTVVAMLGATACVGIAIWGFLATKSSSRVIPIALGVVTGVAGLLAVKILVGGI